ncbi:glycosyltransferase family 4 protein [Lactococcus garvieae]|uniref:glycosyltransferase family 4 protein n=1 Tax=Lactococcus garvieae TaxID=1363 RepID=UPI001F6087E5|nr:glycosyltransferase family 4 protein [Lactococcus garvieae]MCI3859737.1 glycosyltransferase family 4 protein [Lactococcus garvieae]
MTRTVAFFSGFYVPFFGGIERYTYNISKKLVARGYRVIIITSKHSNDLSHESIEEGIKIYRLPIYNFGKKRYPFPRKNKTYKELLKKIKAENIDYFVINTRFQLPSLIGAKIAKEQGKQAIVTEHGTTYLTINSKFFDKILHIIEKLLIAQVKKNSKIFYGVSQEAANWLSEFNITAKGVLYNAIDSNDFPKYFKDKKCEDKIRISYAGRLQAHFKGVETLLAAFAKLSKEFDNLELTIAGDGPIYEDMVAKHPQDNIIFLGEVSHDRVMQMNSASDIFVLLSKIEGFSTALLEAGLLKNALITTNVGGAGELLPNDSYGFIIENNEKALMDALRDLITHPEKRKSMQETISTHIMTNFTWEITADAFETAFSELEE